MGGNGHGLGTSAAFKDKKQNEDRTDETGDRNDDDESRAELEDCHPLRRIR